MQGISFTSLRVGKKYWLTNFGERYEFEILEAFSSQDYLLKDLYTLEQYHLSDLVSYGKGKDFELRDLS